ncbi:MAG: hypothetical protein M1305_02590 [Candidatus Marsarchaeota archaeon]|nr:hypothetical protein [Candidatus Marsarchaeota archaeon]
MRKPDPTRFVGRGLKPDELKMKGFSAPVPPDLIAKEEPETSPPTGEPARSMAKLGAEQKRPDVRTDGRTYGRTYVRKAGRVKIRHAFDIFEDQLRALQLLQLEAVRADKKKRKLGEMVQEAIDLFLERQGKGDAQD